MTMQKTILGLISLFLWMLSFPFAVSAQSAPSISAETVSQGPSDAPITIVEFSDLQCPFCARATATLEQLMEAYPGKVQRVFKHYPLPFHRDAPLAHEAALAAGEQGKFWDMHGLLFANQRAIQRADLVRYAIQLGLNVDQFAAALESRKYQAQVEADTANERSSKSFLAETLIQHPLWLRCFHSFFRQICCRFALLL